MRQSNTFPQLEKGSLIAFRAIAKANQICGSITQLDRQCSMSGKTSYIGLTSVEDLIPTVFHFNLAHQDLSP
jgi:hypothetical protein